MGDGGSRARSALAGVVAWTAALGVACDRGAADTPVRAAAAAKGGLGGGGGGAGGTAGEGGSATSAQGGGGGGAPAGGGGSGGGAAGAGGVDAGAVCVGCGKLLVVPDTDPASLCPEAQDKLDSFRDCICKTTCAALCGDNACAEEPATADCEACISTSCQDAYFACMADD